MNILSSNLCGSNRSTLNALINSLGCVEKYDATQVRCCSFAKTSDIIDGINARLSNMAGGYLSLLEVSHGKTQRRFICVASFQMLLTSICLYKRKCSVRQVALLQNALSKRGTKLTSVKILQTSAYNGCSMLYGRSVWVMPTLQIYS